eukprot:TRINITY_DN12134_c0_g2_i1.p1 TRINITY_DN12134_c0_g2~~TRINITY_DN12134_c0_g2_i1.p1  ORF type:complete len:182 (-),score=42.52 TRINITY_DN12134_c0_g2_i1:74-619(-)
MVSVGETISTLNFAKRAKMVRNIVKLNKGVGGALLKKTMSLKRGELKKSNSAVVGWDINKLLQSAVELKRLATRDILKEQMGGYQSERSRSLKDESLGSSSREKGSLLESGRGTSLNKSRVFPDHADCKKQKMLKQAEYIKRLVKENDSLKRTLNSEKTKSNNTIKKLKLEYEDLGLKYQK